jgi:DNA-binding transcriptional LysR family regulator
VLSFETYLETLVAAERGLGVAFGMFPMTTHWLTAGRLAAPLCQRTPIEGGVYLVFRPQDPRRELLVRIAAWLRAEYGRLPALPDGPVTPRA